MKPRFLPEIRPTEFNYCVDILGKWHGMNYRFIQLFRTDRKDAISPEFEAPFTRLEYVVPDHFQLSYHRHTGQWHCVYRGLTLNDALATIESEELFRPI